MYLKMLIKSSKDTNISGCGGKKTALLTSLISDCNPIFSSGLQIPLNRDKLCCFVRWPVCLEYRPKHQLFAELKFKVLMNISYLPH